MSDYQGNIVIKNPATPAGPFENGAAPGVWKLSEVLPFVRQGIWPTQGVQAPDTFFRNVSLLLSTTALSNANNNLFVDSSGAFNPISRNGNTTQGSATPYSASWSNYFDGSGDHFTVPYTAANFDWWSTDYTIEAWVFPTNLSTWQDTRGFPTMVGNLDPNGETNYWSFGPLANGTVRLYYFNGGGNTVTSTATVATNTWTHIALTKTSSGITIYVNGVAGSTTAVSGTPQSSTGYNLVVGQSYGYSAAGNISNLRIVRGTAIYSGNFTVPTAPLTAVTNTTLLTCQSNRFRDASTNNLTLTVTGNTSVLDFSPFAPARPGISYNQSDITNWSGYFDGTGDYLTVPSNTALTFGTGDFTVEFWINVPSFANFRQHVSTRPSDNASYWSIDSKADGTFYFYTDTFVITTAAQPTNAWLHIAAVRASGTLTLYVNGVSQGSASLTNNFLANTLGIGAGPSGAQPTVGNISNLRIVKGTAVYTGAFTPPTTNLTAISGTSLLTCQNAAFTDNSTNNFVVTINGNTTVTGNSPFNTVGYWSNYFDGTGDYLSIADNAAFDFGTGDFTIECWVYLNAYNPTFGSEIFSAHTFGVSADYIFNINTTGKLFFQIGSSSSLVTSTSSVPLNTWTHIALVRSGNTFTPYINGVNAGGAATSSSAVNSSRTLTIGSDLTGNAGSSLNGYISNHRVVKGTAVYTTTFTPPTSPLTAISGTSLLTCQNGRFIDNSTNAFTITVTGNTSVQSFDPFYTSTIASNGGSMYFDGTGDYLAAPSSPAFNLGTANYTVEFFIYTSSTTSQMVFDTIQPGISGGGSNRFYVHTNTSQQIVVGPATNTLTSSSSIQLRAWNHVAVVRSGTTRTIYINGVSAGSSTQSENLSSSFCTIGFDAASGGSIIMNGYLSNLRVTKGTAVYTANFTPPTAPLTPSANTSLLTNGMNAGAYDATAINNMETVGNAQVSTVQSKFGGSSAYFDGSGDGLKFPSNTPMSMGTGNFTWELWVRATAASGYQSLIDTRTAALTDGFFFGIDTGTLRPAVFTNATVLVSSTSLTANTWQHLALVRSSGTLTIYLDGTSIGSVANSTNLTSGAGVIGASDSIANPNYFNGYIDDMRITRGIARYTTTFTPPTQAFPPY